MQTNAKPIDTSVLPITDAQKPVALAALYNASCPLGMGFLHSPKPMTADEAAALLKNQTYFDYLNGRVMKISFAGNTLDFRLYDRDNGRGAGWSTVVDALTQPS